MACLYICSGSNPTYTLYIYIYIYIGCWYASAVYDTGQWFVSATYFQFEFHRAMSDPPYSFCCRARALHFRPGSGTVPEFGPPATLHCQWPLQLLPHRKKEEKNEKKHKNKKTEKMDKKKKKDKKQTIKDNVDADWMSRLEGLRFCWFLRVARTYSSRLLCRSFVSGSKMGPDALGATGHHLLTSFLLLTCRSCGNKHFLSGIRVAAAHAGADGTRAPPQPNTQMRRSTTRAGLPNLEVRTSTQLLLRQGPYTCACGIYVHILGTHWYARDQRSPRPGILGMSCTYILEVLKPVLCMHISTLVLVFLSVAKQCKLVIWTKDAPMPHMFSAGLLPWLTTTLPSYMAPPTNPQPPQPRPRPFLG